MDGGHEAAIDNAIQRIKQQVESLSKWGRTKYVLLNNGCDHVEPEPQIPEIIRRANERLEEEEIEVVHSTYEELVRLVKAANPQLKVFRGELHAGRYHPLLSGVYSARIYLKQANFRTQTLLERWAEPMQALSWAMGGRYENDFLWFAWKLLLQNHPHDSICGCSVDQVHKEMLPRFQQAQQIGELMRDEGRNQIISRIGIGEPKENVRPLVIFNPHGWAVEDAVTFQMELPVEVGEKPKSVAVRDASGNAVPVQASNLQVREYHSPFPHDRLVMSCDLKFIAKAPALGYAVYEVEMGGKADVKSNLRATSNSLENEFLRVTANANGTLTIVLKRGKDNDKDGDKEEVIYPECHLFEDTEDAGDEYDYSPAPCSQTITSQTSAARVSLVEEGLAAATLRVDFDLILPASLTSDRMGRCAETVVCPITSLITLYAGVPRVDITTKVVNRAKDHRLRARFSAPIVTDKAAAEVQFGVLERCLKMPEGKGWSQKPQPTKAQQRFVSISDGNTGLCIANEGLPEYEVIRHDARTEIALTLLRCVGWLSRDDGIWRPYNAGPKAATPDAQCLGEHTFRYSIIPHTGDWQQSKVWVQAHQFAVPLEAVMADFHSAELPKELSFITVKPKELVVSALKKAENEDALILRLYNTSANSVTGTLKLSEVLKVRQTRMVNLNENENEELLGQDLVVKDGVLNLNVPPFRIVTLKLKGDERDD